MDKSIPFGCSEVKLEWDGMAPSVLLVPRKLYESVMETNPEFFACMKATYMEPLRG